MKIDGGHPFFTNRWLRVLTFAGFEGRENGSHVSLTYDFHLGSGDNGNVFAVTNNRDNNRTQTFSYDYLNRIASAQSQATTGSKCWGDTYTIDAWGNLTNKTPNRCGSIAAPYL